MSLAISLDQIQRPSFWGEFKAAERTIYGNRDRAAEERRQAILAVIRRNGGRASVAEIQDELGCTMAGVRNITGKMVTSGMIVRCGLKNGSMAYEVLA